MFQKFSNLKKQFLQNPERFFFYAVLVFSALFWHVQYIHSQEFVSSSYKVLDPVMNSGSYGTSNSFKLLGAISQISIGESSSASFADKAGFLYFPFASSPTVSATAGDERVTLSWTASVGYLGWTPSGYTVGRSTVSGGPYSYSSVGNVLTSIRTGLTNGTTYYFVIRVEDAFGNYIATSTEVSSTPVASYIPPAGGGGGGGGGWGGGGDIPVPPLAQTKVIIHGRAYPKAFVFSLKDGAMMATPIADDNGNWTVETYVSGGIYTFSFYAKDRDDRRSLTISYNVNVPAGQTTTMSDIIIGPTIGADKSMVKVGNDIKFFGFGYPKSDINVVVNSEVVITDKTKSDKTGFWTYVLNSKPLEMGFHTTKSQVVAPDTITSGFSESLAFQVGETDSKFGKLIGEVPDACSKKGDLNKDDRVNIVDFSILMYFWNQKNPKNKCADINVDGIVNLFDFSIMLYWWSG